MQDAGGNADRGVRRSLFRATKTLHAFLTAASERASERPYIHPYMDGMIHIDGWNTTHVMDGMIHMDGWSAIHVMDGVRRGG